MSKENVLDPSYAKCLELHADHVIFKMDRN